jgi:hypothetical protein
MVDEGRCIASDCFGRECPKTPYALQRAGRTALFIRAQLPLGDLPLMAKVELNKTVSALRGKIDDWVYRQQDGQTIVTPYREPKARTPSPAQKQARARFQAAHAYATEVLSDPLRRAVYQKIASARKRPANVLLASNFLTPPTIEVVETAAYTGRVGELIRIVAFDAIAVAAVTVAIRTSNGVPVESGEAMNDHGVWNYRTTANVVSRSSLQIEVTARNHARAEAKQVKEMLSA